MSLVALVGIGKPSLVLLGQVLGNGMDGYRSLGSSRPRQIQIACAVNLAESSGLFAIVAQGDPGIAGNIYFFGRLAFKLHAAVRAFDGFTIPMDTHVQMILEFYGNVIISIMVFLHLGQDIGLAPIPEIPGAIVFLVGYRGIPKNPDGTAQILFNGGIHGFPSATGRNGKCPIAQDFGNRIIDLFQLVFRSRPAGNIILPIPVCVLKPGNKVSCFCNLAVTDDTLIPHNNRAGRHRIKAGDILGQLQGEGGIAIFILAGNDADVVVLRGVRGIVHQLVLRDAALDGHLLVQGGIEGFPIVPGQLQPVFQGSHGVVISITALIGNPGHGRLHGFFVLISPIGDTDGYRAHPIILVGPIEDQLPCFPCSRSGGCFPQRQGMGIEVTIQLDRQRIGILIRLDLHIGAAVVVTAIRAGSLDG